MLKLKRKMMFVLGLNDEEWILNDLWRLNRPCTSFSSAHESVDSGWELIHQSTRTSWIWENSNWCRLRRYRLLTNFWRVCQWYDQSIMPIYLVEWAMTLRMAIRGKDLKGLMDIEPNSSRSNENQDLCEISRCKQPRWGKYGLHASLILIVSSMYV